jgi:putative Holliday junction resolvase
MAATEHQIKSIDSGRVLAVDPGSKRIGTALSDPTRTLASPLSVIKHVSLKEDCQTIINLCMLNEVALILVGIALSEDDTENPAMRHARKVATQLQEMTKIPVILWDESGSTQQAKADDAAANKNRKNRAGHLDEHAAAVILRSYLESIRRKDMS